MKKFRLVFIILSVLLVLTTLSACTLDDTDATTKDTDKTLEIARNLAESQPTPTDINYSLERYNLIRRAYWVNGQREKAMNLPCAITRPMGYVVLMTESGAVVGRFTVDGKVTSLNSYLAPDSEYYEYSGDGKYTYINKWLADVDGSYGSNDDGVFFFTTDGKYVEWSGVYLYSDIPFIL